MNFPNVSRSAPSNASQVASIAGGGVTGAALGAAGGATLGAVVALLNPVTWIVGGGIGFLAVQGGLDINQLPDFTTFASGWFNDGVGRSAGLMTGVTISAELQAAAAAAMGAIYGTVGGLALKLAQLVGAKS